MFSQSGELLCARLLLFVRADRFGVSIIHVCGLICIELIALERISLITNSTIKLSICTEGKISRVRWFIMPLPHSVLILEIIRDVSSCYDHCCCCRPVLVNVTNKSHPL